MSANIASGLNADASGSSSTNIAIGNNATASGEPGLWAGDPDV